MTERTLQLQQGDMKRQMEMEQQQIRLRMSRIKHKILILSGKVVLARVRYR